MPTLLYLIACLMSPSPLIHLAESRVKTELIYLEDFDTHEQAHTAVFEYIEVFYNRQRCHSAHGYLAPLVYEQALQTNESLCPEKC